MQAARTVYFASATAGARCVGVAIFWHSAAVVQNGNGSVGSALYEALSIKMQDPRLPGGTKEHVSLRVGVAGIRFSSVVKDAFVCG